jgi:CheY-like chemotaxis protein
MKTDDHLKAIPVVILTTSNAAADISASYQHQANAYVTKPMELEEFETAVSRINHFYRTVARLPMATR